MSGEPKIKNQQLSPWYHTIRNPDTGEEIVDNDGYAFENTDMGYGKELEANASNFKQRWWPYTAKPGVHTDLRQEHVGDDDPVYKELMDPNVKGLLAENREINQARFPLSEAQLAARLAEDVNRELGWGVTRGIVFSAKIMGKLLKFLLLNRFVATSLAIYGYLKWDNTDRSYTSLLKVVISLLKLVPFGFAQERVADLQNVMPFAAAADLAHEARQMSWYNAPAGVQRALRTVQNAGPDTIQAGSRMVEAITDTATGIFSSFLGTLTAAQQILPSFGDMANSLFTPENATMIAANLTANATQASMYGQGGDEQTAVGADGSQAMMGNMTNTTSVSGSGRLHRAYAKRMKKVTGGGEDDEERVADALIRYTSPTYRNDDYPLHGSETDKLAWLMASKRPLEEMYDRELAVQPWTTLEKPLNVYRGDNDRLMDFKSKPSNATSYSTTKRGDTARRFAGKPWLSEKEDDDEDEDEKPAVMQGHEPIVRNLRLPKGTSVVDIWDTWKQLPETNAIKRLIKKSNIPPAKTYPPHNDEEYMKRLYEHNVAYNAASPLYHQEEVVVRQGPRRVKGAGTKRKRRC